MSDRPREQLPLQPWMKDSATRAVIEALQAEGQAVRFVGGCVRDALLERLVRDVDIATPDPPEQVMALLHRGDLKVVATGLSHGTLTAISGGRPYEVTTLRTDVETFGRHARVAFTSNWQEDAARRDFTMNALSCTPEGWIWDYFGGIADARAGRVRFVGDPQARIAEDYLRLLRFFRFLAHYGRGAPNAPALEATAEAAPMLARLSGERIRDELLRLLDARDPVPTLQLMQAHGILAEVLPEVGESSRLQRLLTLHPQADPLLRLGALLTGDAADAARVAERLRLSNADRDRLIAFAQGPIAVHPGMESKALGTALYRHGRSRVADWLYLSASRGQGRPEQLNEDLRRLAEQPDRHFPLKGRDLLPLGVSRGPGLGQLLTDLEAWWIDQNFAPDRKALLEEAFRRLRGS